MKQIPKSSYPNNLKIPVYQEMPLWYLGDLELLKSPMASIIGTRDLSENGLLRTRRITRFLVSQGFVVVSGLAKGVDATAHWCTLEAGGKTIAVMGTPIDQCYPKENSDLKNEISSRGLVISQFEPESKVFRSNFPKRNSLMAALSDFTVVVEAGEKSGTRHQVLSSIRMRKPVAFLASLGDKNYSWVNEALNSGCGFLLNNPDDLLDLVTAHTANQADNPMVQRSFLFNADSSDDSDDAEFDENDLQNSASKD